VTLLLSILFDAPLEQAANPNLTPNPAKAPWYFLWLQELVASTTIRLGRVTISGGFVGGILIPGVLLLVAALWPFLDRTPESAEGIWWPRERLVQNLAFTVIALAIVALILVSLYFRGPSWGFYWPWQAWPASPSTL
jgi:cytochrome b-561